MKKFMIFGLVLFLIACSTTSESSIQTAIAKTENSKVPDYLIQTAIAKTQAVSTPLTSNFPDKQITDCQINSPIKNDWKTIVCETFDNKSTWPEETDHFGSISSVINGKHVIDFSSKNTEGYKTGFYHALKVGDAKDYVVSLTGKINSKYKNCTWGIIVRGPYNEGYEFAIDNQGAYYLTYNGSSNLYLGNLKYGANNAIRWNSENTITALVENRAMTFYVNGKKIISYEADNSYNTQISWTYWAAEGVIVSYEFDNLLIKEKTN